jgi:hypothetical protein
MGAKVIAVSKDNWIKTDFGADHIIRDYDGVVAKVNRLVMENGRYCPKPIRHW